MPGAGIGGTWAKRWPRDASCAAQRTAICPRWSGVSQRTRAASAVSALNSGDLCRQQNIYPNLAI
jgi:hypothetical protein